MGLEENEVAISETEAGRDVLGWLDYHKRVINKERERCYWDMLACGRATWNMKEFCEGLRPTLEKWEGNG